MVGCRTGTGGAERVCGGIPRRGAPLADDLSQLKQRLYALATDADELARAAHAAHGGWPAPEQELDFLDFYAVEWVDRSGRTLVERAVAAGQLPPAVAAWSEGVRTALWVVDGWEGELVLLRDIATEDEVAVRAPGLEGELPRRAVLRARVIPHDGHLVFSGEPDVYEPMGVIARMDLLRGWHETPEPALLTRLAERRATFRRLREERDAFVTFFGADEQLFADADALGEALARFVHHLHHEHPFPSLGGRTRARAWRMEKGDEPTIVRFELGESLRGPGRPGAIYDPVEGIHFLPSYGEFLAHLRGDGDHPDVVAWYLDDPGITSLPFRRAGRTDRLAALLGRPDAPLEALLDGVKPLEPGPPSVLPSLED